MHSNTPTRSRWSAAAAQKPRGVPFSDPQDPSPKPPSPWPLSDVSIVCSCSSTSVRMLNNISPLRNNGTSRLSPTSSTFYLWHQLKVLLFMLARCSGNFPPDWTPSPGSLQLSQVVAATFVAYFRGTSFLSMWQVFAFAYCPAWKGKKFGFVAKLNATCVCFTAATSLCPASCWRPAKSPWRCKL